ncbi:M14 family metallocarboxypeptidase [Diaphorobacter sp. HDW4A]|uniref:M14 family metallopeptidase n=1 Tax=Diaphorobacter sp. HDW4A TaxID=2714924 RepID=UPI00352FF6DB
MSAALLAACSSTPLPPWPAHPGAVTSSSSARQAPTQAPQRQVPPQLGTQRGPQSQPSQQQVQTGAVSSSPLLPNSVDDPQSTGNLPYNTAVAARFPAPDVRYATPGLEQGRRAFTTNNELSDWLNQLAATGSGRTHAQVQTIGSSQNGVPLQALIITQAAGTTPDALDDSKRPTIMLVGQQHGDEPAGSEALLIIARELTQGLLEPLLQRINVVIVPRANPDGADAHKRVTSNGIDMNRDHLLLNTPEAQALAKLSNAYRPIAMIDAHEYTVVGRYLQKFNAVQKYDALLQHAATANMPEFVTKAATQWYLDPIRKSLQDQQLTSDWYYTTSTDLADRSLSMGGAQPDTGRNVNGLKNAVSLLIETRGVGMERTDIQRRVHAQVTAIGSALRTTAERASELQQVRSFVTREISSQACRGSVVIEAAQTPEKRDVTMLDPNTGADTTLNVDWNSSLHLRTLKTRPRPCGYWLSAQSNTAVERLQMLGVQVMRVAESGNVLADTYVENSRSTAERPDVRGTVAGGGPITRVSVTPTRSAIDIPEGSYYVPLNQTMANVAIAALEPDSQNSYFANNLIDHLDSVARLMTVPALVFEDTD